MASVLQWLRLAKASAEVAIEEGQEQVKSIGESNESGHEALSEQCGSLVIFCRSHEAPGQGPQPRATIVRSKKFEDSLPLPYLTTTSRNLCLKILQNLTETHEHCTRTITIMATLDIPIRSKRGNGPKSTKAIILV